MKKILVLMMILFSIPVFSQHFHYKNVYTNIDTLNVETVVSMYPTENNDYLIELPKDSKLVVAYGKDKAIILDCTGFPFYRHKEYNIKEDSRRIIFWYEDKILYCGFVYDKKLNSAQYCETINKKEFKNLMKQMPFLNVLPFSSKILINNRY